MFFICCNLISIIVIRIFIKIICIQLLYFKARKSYIRTFRKRIGILLKMRRIGTVCQIFSYLMVF